jgi:uncharacterized repeat protein (TIGR01451 family)
MNATAGGGHADLVRKFLRPASQLAPTAAVLTATKTDNLAQATQVDPGGTNMYTIEITNTGDANATNVNFTDTIDPNTTPVPGSVVAGPIAVNDNYNTIGNVIIQIPVAQGVLQPNDFDTGALRACNSPRQGLHQPRHGLPNESQSAFRQESDVLSPCLCCG